ncbi:hypothetical protein [Paraburkholderia solisilvae]|uniref:Cyclic nucleotide-binding domain-containing protein n=1 Tax=Paraburkholderia solisilvae TaxID=624376 RepID=A0A6J5E8E6_9BURK|nr:hypothetical protein [Paraburkholderia solisilvae]CAB3761626.1 hypothetical protein LMG29739_03669 [Paraburkholderia solisilvae]
MTRFLFFAGTVSLVLLVLAAACDSGQSRAAAARASENPAMKPSVTYLHLLRKTPFFTSLNTAQLRWTIEHSREWEAQGGTVIVDCATSKPKDDFWILLDGGWQVETGGHIYPSGHADPGKWFSAAQATNGDCRLIATEHSYVMHITRADMDDMLSRGFPFDAHLNAGRAFYREVFGADAAQR